MMSRRRCRPMSAAGCPLPDGHRHSECQRRISVHGVSDSWGSKYQSAGRHQTYSISESKKVQAPYGAQVLSVMCWRTDRWVPPTERAGSEGGIKYHCAGKVRRLSAPILYAAYRRQNLYNRPGGRWKCTPFGANAPPFPRRGNFACYSASGLISSPKYSGAGIGAHFLRMQPSCMAFCCR